MSKSVARWACVDAPRSGHVSCGETADITILLRLSRLRCRGVDLRGRVRAAGDSVEQACCGHGGGNYQQPQSRSTQDPAERDAGGESRSCIRRTSLPIGCSHKVRNPPECPKTSSLIAPKISSATRHKTLGPGESESSVARRLRLFRPGNTALPDTAAIARRCVAGQIQTDAQIVSVTQQTRLNSSLSVN